MSFDFKRRNLQKTARYEMPRISPDPAKPITLITRHMGATNSDYVNAEIKRLRVEGRVDGLADRRRQIESLAAVCVVGWENVSEDGAAVEWSPEKALLFLEAVDADYPDEIDLYRWWAANVGNFIEPIGDPSALGKE